MDDIPERVIQNLRRFNRKERYYLIGAALGNPKFKLGGPKLTNEVQHLVKVLSWEKDMDMSPLKRGVKLPDYKPRDTRSAKSRQVWIARHRQWLVS